MSPRPDRPAAPEGAVGWTSVALLREAIVRLNRRWIALDDPVRTVWWMTFAAGLVATIVLTAAVVFLGRTLEASGRLTWEGQALRWIAELPLSFSGAMWLEGVGNGFVLWGVVLLAAGVAAWRGYPLRTIALLMGHTLLYLLIAFGWWLWDRPRPQIILEGLADPGGVFRAYPSGHMVQSAFAYGFLVRLWVLAAQNRTEQVFAVGAYFALLAVVALGRLRIGAHWPSDMVAGLVIGIGWLAAVSGALHRAERVERAPADRSPEPAVAGGLTPPMGIPAPYGPYPHGERRPRT